MLSHIWYPRRKSLLFRSRFYLLFPRTSKTVRKPITMRFDDAIRASCHNLRQSGQCPLDPLIVHSVQLHSILEDVASVFSYESLNGKHPSIETVDLSIATFERQFRDVQECVQSAGACSRKSRSFLATQYRVLMTSVHFKLAWLHAWVYLYEVALHIPPPVLQSGSSCDLSQDSGTRGHLVSKHSLLLTRCLEHTKNLMDHYVNLSLEQVLKNTLVEKGYLAHATMLLIKLAFSTANGIPQNPFPLRKACDVSNYLYLLANRGGRLEAALDSGDNIWVRDHLVQFRDKILRLKSWYDRMEFYGTEGADAAPPSGMLQLQYFDEIMDRELPPLDFEMAMVDFMNFDEAGFGFEGAQGVQ